ncbi:MAG: type II toxin-antitoxin system RelE/ParE family toxin [Thermodesulfobacteriota bacterium]|nr:type II toxin-antitoxin system RelE/ParE family toxin [Thermodesulfobacteriota bacterium]
MRIKWLGDAVSDLVEIRKYIATDNPGAARNVAERIKKEIAHLKEYSGLGRPGRVEGTRELIISGFPYIIPYRVKNDVVEILSVLHGARKWPEEL